MNDLERIARLLCEGDGCDPDAMVFAYPPPVDARQRMFANTAPSHPSWQFYVGFVQGTLDAVTTGAQDGDLKQIIDHVLSGEDIPVLAVEEIPDPPPAPNWRTKYGLV